MDTVLFRRSVNHALTLLLAALLIIVCWFFFRLPGASLLLVTFTYLSTSLLYDVHSWTSRLICVSQMALYAGALQFLIGMTVQTRFYVLLLPAAFSYFVLRTMRTRQGACIILLAGHLGYFSPGGFLPSFSRWIELFIAGGAVMLATSLVGIVHIQSNYETLNEKPYSVHESLSIVMILLTASTAMHLLNFIQSGWIVLTAVFLLMADTSRQSVLDYAVIRTLAVPVGLYSGFLFMGCFTWFNAYMIYTIPFLAVLAFFTLYYTGSYFWYTVLFMLAFSLYADFSTGTGKFFNLLAVAAGRSLATGIGAAITLFYNFVLYHSTRNKEEIS